MRCVPKPRLKLPVRQVRGRSEGLEVGRGQALVLFVLLLPVLIGIMGLAIDLSYAWIQQLRVQSAADAAALAGAVYLPYDVDPANAASQAVAVQNGYTNGTGGVTVLADQDETYMYQQNVSITTPVPTFFMRLFGVNSLTVTRTAHAQYNLPLPMGSPLNVFGYPSATDQQGNALNYWASIQGPCTTKKQGDPFATELSGSVSNAPSNCSTYTTTNDEYHVPKTNNTGAYDFSVKVATAGTLSIQLYDPEYCPRSSQADDTGDYAFTSGSKFTTTYTLYSPSSTPYDLSTYTLVSSVTYPGNGSTSTSDGQSGKTNSCSSYWVHTVSSVVTGGGTGSINCPSAGNCTNPWVQFASIAATPGTYRLNVETDYVGTSPADGYNSYSIKATLNGGSTGVQVFGGDVATQSSMSVWNNLQSGTSWIYLAQVSQKNAGHTLVVYLFDPGDVNGTAKMYIEMPNATGTSYSDATFSYSTHGSSLKSGTQGTVVPNVTYLTTASNGTSNFNGQWVVVTIQIPATYTVTNDNGGWWKIKYVISGGAAHDRTTWSANILNSPVHLVP